MLGVIQLWRVRDHTESAWKGDRRQRITISKWSNQVESSSTTGPAQVSTMTMVSRTIPTKLIMQLPVSLVYPARQSMAIAVAELPGKAPTYVMGTIGGAEEYEARCNYCEFTGDFTP